MFAKQSYRVAEFIYLFTNGCTFFSQGDSCYKIVEKNSIDIG